MDSLLFSMSKVSLYKSCFSQRGSVKMESISSTLHHLGTKNVFKLQRYVRDICCCNHKYSAHSFTSTCWGGKTILFFHRIVHVVSRHDLIQKFDSNLVERLLWSETFPSKRTTGGNLSQVHLWRKEVYIQDIFTVWLRVHPVVSGKFHSCVAEASNLLLPSKLKREDGLLRFGV